MVIPWGQSVLKQANDAGVAEDFNHNLHEHFQVARRANMRPTESVADPDASPHASTYGGGDGPKGVQLTHPDTMAHMDIEHNRKTGEVKSGAYEATGFGKSRESSDPNEVRSHLNQAKRESRNFQAREAGGREQYRKELRESKQSSKE